MTDSWVASLPRDASIWTNNLIDCDHYSLDEKGEDKILKKCYIKNISQDIHVEHWRDQLRDWGHVIATTNEIAIIEGNPIDMYPLDHGFPHIHMVTVDTPRYTIAKYRVDRFALMEGVPTFNRPMEQWVQQNRDALLASWKRCQAGEHPFKIN